MRICRMLCIRCFSKFSSFKGVHMCIIEEKKINDFLNDTGKKHLIIGELVMLPKEVIRDVIERINKNGGIYGNEISRDAHCEAGSKRYHAKVSSGNYSVSLCILDVFPDTFPDKEKRGNYPVRLALHKHVPVQ